MTKRKFLFFPTILALAFGLMLSCAKSSSEDSTSSDDTTAPTVYSTYPSDSASSVAPNISLTVTFSEAMDATTITTNSTGTSCLGTLQLSSDSFSTCVQMSASTSISNSNKTFTLNPASNLSYETTYKVKVTTDAKDSAGNALASAYTHSTGFTTSSTPDDTSTSSAITLSGKIQKGPYVQGTEITVRELDSSMIPTGNTFTGTIDDNTGSFSIKGTLTNKIVELSADGYYFNEVSGSLSNAKLTLSALSDITDNSSVNVNLMTHLEKKRVEYLIDSGLTFAAAKTQAQTEIMKIFNIDNVTLGNSETLDISKSGDGNAVLLAISAILQSDKTEAELTELLSTINTDIRTDGTLDSTTTKATLVTAADYLKDLHSAIRSNIGNRYSNLGISATIPSFESYAFNLSATEFCSTCLYVIVGSSGTILTSSTANSWISRTSGISNSLNGVTYGNSTFVAVGNSGNILTSTDGTSWTSRTSGTSNDLHGIIYVNSTFVTVGSSGTILTSSDGTSWTSRNSGTSNTLYGVIYANSTFVTTGEAAILTSGDGISWTSRTSGLSGIYSLNGVNFGNSTFVIIGGSPSSGIIITSSNGTSWTSRTSGTSNSLYEVTYANNTFAAVGSSGTILTSSDNGTSWTSRTSGTSNNLGGVTYVNNTFAAVGFSGTILTSSDNGTSWTSRTSSTTETIHGVSYKE